MFLSHLFSLLICSLLHFLRHFAYVPNPLWCSPFVSGSSVLVLVVQPADPSHLPQGLLAEPGLWVPTKAAPLPPPPPPLVLPLSAPPVPVLLDLAAGCSVPTPLASTRVAGAGNGPDRGQSSGQRKRRRTVITSADPSSVFRTKRPRNTKLRLHPAP
jgi:hypothetical protein